MKVVFAKRSKAPKTVVCTAALQRVVPAQQWIKTISTY